ncbi:MAG: endonuclease/exonuclease/phosphatase family protein [Lentisphaeria bacterium]|nr:endonuclease/exonuclease/phosphatase family protein [Lentisphaeria bacterium]
MKIVSYNLHSGLGMDKAVDFDRIAGIIRAEHPDLTGLQEISIGRADLPPGDPLELLSRKLGQTGYFAQTFQPVFEGKSYSYGIGALSALKAEKVAELALPDLDRHEPRKAVFLKTETTDGKTVYFVDTHLANGSGEKLEQLRLLQIKTIYEWIVSARYAPVILTGDMNATPDSPCGRFLAEKFTLAGDMSPTYPADEPKEKIDYIAFYPQNAFTVKSYRVVPETVASDHRPIAAELTLN